MLNLLWGGWFTCWISPVLANFQKDSPGWQMERWGQRLGENLEHFFSRWRWEPADPGPAPELPDWSWPGWYNKLFYWGLISLLAAIVLWSLYQLLRGQWRDRILQLRQRVGQRSPQPTQHSLSYWLREAQGYAQRQRYGEACQALYQGTLQLLADRALAQHQTSRTDGEYLDLLQLRVRQASQRSAYAKLFNTHGDLQFGGEPASEATYQDCQQAYDRIANPTPEQE